MYGVPNGENVAALHGGAVPHDEDALLSFRCQDLVRLLATTRTEVPPAFIVSCSAHALFTTVQSLI